MTNHLKIIISVSLMLVTYNNYAQKPPTYSDYGVNDKEVIFNEDFSVDKDTNWVSEDDSTVIVIGGTMHCSYKKGSFKASEFEPNVDEKRDYEIEFKAKVPFSPKRKYRYNVGIFFWGRKDSSNQTNYWYFRNTSNSIIYNSIFRCIGWHDCHDYYNNNSKNENKEFNKYTLRKIDDKYYFYVNEVYITQAPVLPFLGKFFGIGAGSHKGTSMAIYDYIRVSYLKKQH